MNEPLWKNGGLTERIKRALEPWQPPSTDELVEPFEHKDPIPSDLKEIIVEALEEARLALCLTHNLLVTDRPDLPRRPDTGWVTSHTKQLARIDGALSVLGVSSDSGFRFGTDKTDPSTGLS